MLIGDLFELLEILRLADLFTCARCLDCGAGLTEKTPTIKERLVRTLYVWIGVEY